jgi:hypothetical protein
MGAVSGGSAGCPQESNPRQIPNDIRIKYTFIDIRKNLWAVETTHRLKISARLYLRVVP